METADAPHEQQKQQASADAAHGALVSGSVAPPQRIHVLVQNPVLLAHVLAFLGSKYTFHLGAYKLVCGCGPAVYKCLCVIRLPPSSIQQTAHDVCERALVLWASTGSLPVRTLHLRCSHTEQGLGDRAHEARGVGSTRARTAPAAAAQLLPPRVVVLLSRDRRPVAVRLACNSFVSYRARRVRARQSIR